MQPNEDILKAIEAMLTSVKGQDTSQVPRWLGEVAEEYRDWLDGTWNPTSAEAEDVFGRYFAAAIEEARKWHSKGLEAALEDLWQRARAS